MVLNKLLLLGMLACIVALPQLVNAEKEWCPCGYCHGTGKVVCSFCGGTGTVSCYSCKTGQGTWMFCNSCGGNGWTKCLYCDGNGGKLVDPNAKSGYGLDLLPDSKLGPTLPMELWMGILSAVGILVSTMVLVRARTRSKQNT